tara:strand:- start:82 stop:192 length:111 start_codon:yes stop_codon:yes gene_type:complete
MFTTAWACSSILLRANDLIEEFVFALVNLLLLQWLL